MSFLSERSEYRIMEKWVKEYSSSNHKCSLQIIGNKQSYIKLSTCCNIFNFPTKKAQFWHLKTSLCSGSIDNKSLIQTLHSEPQSRRVTCVIPHRLWTTSTDLRCSNHTEEAGNKLKANCPSYLFFFLRLPLQCILHSLYLPLTWIVSQGQGNGSLIFFLWIKCDEIKIFSKNQMQLSKSWEMLV